MNAMQQYRLKCLNFASLINSEARRAARYIPYGKFAFRLACLSYSLKKLNSCIKKRASDQLPLTEKFPPEHFIFRNFAKNRSSHTAHGFLPRRQAKRSEAKSHIVLVHQSLIAISFCNSTAHAASGCVFQKSCLASVNARNLRSLGRRICVGNA